jgi:hypothetical protein
LVAVDDNDDDDGDDERIDDQGETGELLHFPT